MQRTKWRGRGIAAGSASILKSVKLSVISAAGALIALTILVSAQSARAFPTQMDQGDLFPWVADLVSANPNECGVTIGNDLWVAASHPMTEGTISQLGTDSRLPPHSGIQVELLTPGDIGLTLHIRW